MKLLKFIAIFTILTLGLFVKSKAQNPFWQPQGSFIVQNLKTTGIIAPLFLDTIAPIGFNNQDSVGALRVRPQDSCLYIKFANRWLGVASFSKLNLKLNIADTANKWAPKGLYLFPVDTVNRWAARGVYLFPGDTVNKWAAKGAYLFPADTINKWAPKGIYVMPGDTTNRWAPKGVYVTAEVDPVWTAASVNYWTKVQSDGRYVQVTDTSNRWQPKGIYVYPADTAGRWAPLGSYIHPGDTALMLQTYLRKGDTASLSNRINQKLNISDTTNKWAPKGTYIFPSDTANRWAPKGTYLYPGDTVSLSNRINLKVNISDTAAMLSGYVRKTAAFSGTGAVTRSLNTPYTISATKGTMVTYSISLVSAALVTGGQLAEVYLEISPNGTTWATVSKGGNVWSGVALIGFSTTSTVAMSAYVPTNYQTRLRTNGAGTITYISGQEIPVPF